MYEVPIRHSNADRVSVSVGGNQRRATHEQRVVLRHGLGRENGDRCGEPLRDCGVILLTAKCNAVIIKILNNNHIV
jgi:hypothetical protein